MRLRQLEARAAAVQRRADVLAVVFDAADHEAACLAVMRLLDLEDEDDASGIVDTRFSYLTRDRREALDREIRDLRDVLTGDG